MLDEGLGSTRARSVAATQSMSKKLPARELLGSQGQHRGKAAQTKPEDITEGKEAAHSPHSKWRRKLFYEECNTKNISVNAGYINNSCK